MFFLFPEMPLDSVWTQVLLFLAPLRLALETLSHKGSASLKWHKMKTNSLRDYTVQDQIILHYPFLICLFLLKENNKNHFPFPSSLSELVYQLVTNLLPLFFLIFFFFRYNKPSNIWLISKWQKGNFPTLRSLFNWILVSGPFLYISN